MVLQKEESAEQRRISSVLPEDLPSLLKMTPSVVDVEKSAQSQEAERSFKSNSIGLKTQISIKGFQAMVLEEVKASTNIDSQQSMTNQSHRQH